MSNESQDCPSSPAAHCPLAITRHIRLCPRRPSQLPKGRQRFPRDFSRGASLLRRAYAHTRFYQLKSLLYLPPTCRASRFVQSDRLPGTQPNGRQLRIRKPQYPLCSGTQVVFAPRRGARAAIRARPGARGAIRATARHKYGVAYPEKRLQPRCRMRLPRSRVLPPPRAGTQVAICVTARHEYRVAYPRMRERDEESGQGQHLAALQPPLRRQAAMTNRPYPGSSSDEGGGAERG